MEHSWKWNIPTYLNIFIRIKIFIIRVSFFKYIWKIPFPRDNQSNHIIIIWYEWKLIHICNLRWLHKTQCFITLMNEHEEEKKLSTISTRHERVNIQFHLYFPSPPSLSATRYTRLSNKYGHGEIWQSFFYSVEFALN